MKLALQVVLLLQLIVFCTSSFSAVKLNAKNNGNGIVSIVMSALEYSDDADDAIRPSILLSSVERSRDRRRTLVADKICYSQSVALASLSVFTVEKFYDTLVNVPDALSYFNITNNCNTDYFIAPDFLSRANVVLLI